MRMIDVGKAQAAERFEVIIGWLFVEQNSVSHFVVYRGGRKNVQKVNWSLKSFHPVSRRDTSLEHEGVDGIVDSMDHTLRPPILLARVGTREAHNNAVGWEVVVKSGVVVLPTIIILKWFYLTFELRLNKVSDVNEFWKHFRFFTQRIYP